MTKPNPTTALPADVERNQFDGRLQPPEYYHKRFKKHFARYYKDGGRKEQISLSEMKEWFALELVNALSSQRAAIAEEVEKKRGDYDSRFEDGPDFLKLLSKRDIYEIGKEMFNENIDDVLTIIKSKQ